MLQIVAQLPNSTRSAVATLTMSEIENAGRAPVPHLHGSEQLDRYQPWGDAGYTYVRLLTNKKVLPEGTGHKAEAGN